MTPVEVLLALLGLLQAAQLVVTARTSARIDEFLQRVTELEKFNQIKHGFESLR